MELFNILTLVVGIVVYYLCKIIVHKIVSRIGKERQIADARIAYVSSFLNFILIVFIASVVILVSRYDIKSLGLFIGSTFAFLGVALFAQWSILSNITASILVFFFFPYRVGDTVEILDGENSIYGKIRDINLFHVILSEECGSISTYPNTLIFQKAVRINPETRQSLTTIQRLEKVQNNEK